MAALYQEVLGLEIVQAHLVELTASVVLVSQLSLVDIFSTQLTKTRQSV
jgi:hypothetical protein